MDIFPSEVERRVPNNTQILHLALEICDRIEALDKRLSEHINTDKEAIRVIMDWLQKNKK